LADGTRTPIISSVSRRCEVTVHLLRQAHRAAAALAVPLLLATCKGSTEPAAVATTIAVTPATLTLAAIGRTQQFGAVVFDQKRDTMRGASVTWSSSVTSVLKVTATGLATAVANGTAQVVATSGTATGQATVTVTQVAAALAKTSGDLQTATVGQTLPNPVVVQVQDSAGQPVSGATVIFVPSAGSGTAAPETTSTNASGQAQATWTLGTTAGPSRDYLTAWAGAAAATFTASANPGPATQLVKTAGDFQRTLAGRTVGTAPAVAVRDQYGNGVPGDSVTFVVVSGGGSVTGGRQATGATGLATVGNWTVGASAGINTLTATAAGSGLAGNPATFTDSAFTLGAPATVAAWVGNNQVGLVGYAVNVRPGVLVTDAASNPIPGAVVTFAVASGGGSGTRLTDTTDSGGHAQVGPWILGTSPGLNTMTATVGGAPTATFTDTSAVAEFTIQLQYYGKYSPTAAESAAFNHAVTRWQQMVYRHFGPPETVTDSAGDCGAGEPALTNRTITDVLIFASFDSIDGPNKTLAEASPCFVTTGTGPGSGLTVVGTMLFDTADVGSLIAAGQLDAVVLHEMGHVLGFGTLWDLIDYSPPFPPVNCLQLPSNVPSPLLDTYFSCSGGTAYAEAEFDSVGGTTYTGAGQPYGGHKVPVENCANYPYTYPTCGQGTVDSHWRTSVFGNELMVGFLPSAPALSVVTLGSLQDLGYTVNYAAADRYTNVFRAPPAGGAARLFLGDDIHHGPLYMIDRSGRITLVRRRQ
jgi:hypothetical protein